MKKMKLSSKDVIEKLRVKLIETRKANTLYKKKISRLGELISESLQENQMLMDALKKEEGEKGFTARFRVLMASSAAQSIQGQKNRGLNQQKDVNESAVTADHLEDALKSKDEEIARHKRNEEALREELESTKIELERSSQAMDDTIFKLRKQHEEEISNLKQKIEQNFDEKTEYRNTLKQKIEKCRQLEDEIIEIKSESKKRTKDLEAQLEDQKKQNFYKTKKIKEVLKNLKNKTLEITSEVQKTRQDFSYDIQSIEKYARSQIVELNEKIEKYNSDKENSVNLPQMDISPVKAFMESRDVIDMPKRSAPNNLILGKQEKSHSKKPVQSERDLKIKNLEKDVENFKGEVAQLAEVVLDQKEQLRAYQDEGVDDMSVLTEDEIVHDPEALKEDLTALRREKDRLNHELTGLNHDLEEAQEENEKAQQAIDEAVDYYNHLRGKILKVNFRKHWEL